MKARISLSGLRTRIRYRKSTVKMPHFGDHQTEIYFRGLRGMLPSLPADFKLLEQRAQAAMPPSVLSYVQGAAAMSSRKVKMRTRFIIGGLFLACWWTAPRATS